MKKTNTLKLAFFAAIAVLGAGIYFVTDNLIKSVVLIIGIALVLGVFFNILLRILENTEKGNNGE